MMKHSFLSSSLTVGILLAGTSCPAQNVDISKVREALYDLDRSQAAELAGGIYAAHPDDPVARSWFAVLTRASKSTDAVHAMEKADAKSAWTLLARAKSASPLEVKILCDEAVAKAPGDSDILFLATRQMMDSFYAMGDEEQSQALRANLRTFVSANAAAYEKSSHLLALRASAELEMAKAKPSSSAPAEDGYAPIATLADRALQLDPSEAEAMLIQSELLIRKGDKQSGYDLLQTAVHRKPHSVELWSAYANALFNAPSLSGKESQRKQILADIKMLLDQGEPSRELIAALSYNLKPAGPDTLATIGDTILSKYPDSAAADEIRYRQAIEDDPNIVSDFISPAKAKAIQDFLALPKHPDAKVVEKAKSQLLYIESSLKDPDLGLIFQLLKERGIDQDYDAQPVAALAKHSYHLAELQKIAEHHLDREWTPFIHRTLDQTDRTGFLDFSLGYFVSPWQSALGLIYLKQGKLDEALEKIEASLALDPENLNTNLHLGEVYEAQGEPAKAEKTYQAALSKIFVGAGEHPAVDALRRNYEHQHPGDKAGLDAYMRDIVAKDAARRRDAVLNARNRDPKPLPAFTLKTLDGKTVSSADLKGKVIVINFWATWCGPCREELPDFEKLSQKYSQDPSVAILTIATDAVDTPVQTIASFIHAHKYDFAVLLGPGYAEAHGASPIPMTWFIDPSGQEVYRKMGYTKELVQEFGWRIEALRTPAKTEANKPSAAGN